jgi:antitoxin CptB
MSRGRLLWRCRRGMKELDVLLEHYVQSSPAVASGESALALERLLELPDPTLADYLFGQAVCPDTRLARLVADIRASGPACAPANQ